MGSSSFAPNGLKRGEGSLDGMVVDHERWSRAEARVSELLRFIQPNHKSETRRNAVISYLQNLLITSVPCQVFTFGSASLKTYLPDGDIDLTVFGDHHQFLDDSLIFKILHILQTQLNSQNSQFQVKDVEYVPAKVKIIKCIVDIFVVDISFNQLGGLCALCFLEEINAYVDQNHLFKRSVLLIKAWCYYESRILSSINGLFSTYALAILVLYIFNLYNNSFSGPLEVLYRFLEFYDKFDWDSYCISLRGPVPIVSLPSMRAEPPRRDSQDILLPEVFLEKYEELYGYMPFFQGNQEQSFVSKHMNIIDPLCANNNLGKSICKGNFLRIRSAIALGATRVRKILDCLEENLVAQVDFLFRNTWDRHGNGCWVPVYLYNFYLRNKIFSKEFPSLKGKINLDEITEAYNGSSSISGNVSGVKTPASYAGVLKGRSSVLDTEAVIGSSSSPIASRNQSSSQHCNIELENHSDTSRVVYSIDQDSECSITGSSDIFICNFESYWRNLQYGWFCKNAEMNRALFYPPTNAPPGPMNIVARGAPLFSEMPHTFAPPSFWLPGIGSTFMPNLPSYHQNSRMFSSHRQDQMPRNLNSNSGEWFSSSGQVHYNRAERPGTSKTWHRGESSNGAVNKVAKSKSRSR